MLGCTAALAWMRHGRDGKVLDLGRRRCCPSAALRKAARERDRGRCRYPGCESRRVDLHHIRHWANGGPTSLDNLVSLCRRHHTAVHDRGYTIATARRRHLHLLPARRHPPAAKPAPAVPGRRHRRRPRRGHHPGHDHPAVVRGAAGPGLRHLHLPGQRAPLPGPRGRPRPPGRHPALRLPPRRARRPDRLLPRVLRQAPRRTPPTRGLGANPGTGMTPAGVPDRRQGPVSVKVVSTG